MKQSVQIASQLCKSLTTTDLLVDKDLQNFSDKYQEQAYLAVSLINALNAVKTQILENAQEFHASVPAEKIEKVFELLALLLDKLTLLPFTKPLILNNNHKAISEMSLLSMRKESLTDEEVSLEIKTGESVSSNTVFDFNESNTQEWLASIDCDTNTETKEKHTMDLINISNYTDEISILEALNIEPIPMENETISENTRNMNLGSHLIKTGRVEEFSSVTENPTDIPVKFDSMVPNEDAINQSAAKIQEIESISFKDLPNQNIFLGSIVEDTKTMIVDQPSMTLLGNITFRLNVCRARRYFDCDDQLTLLLVTQFEANFQKNFC